MKRLRFATLRARFLLPLLGTALIAAVIVAVVSARMGRRWAMQEVQARFAGIESTLGESAFPLTASVLQSLADLTGTELVTMASDDSLLSETLSLSSRDLPTLQKELRESSATKQEVVSVADHSFLSFKFRRSGKTLQNDRVASVLVLFDQDRIDESSRRAALLPLVTGLSTIVFLTTVMLGITRSLVRRLVRLQQGVQRVAAGDFLVAVSDETIDEVGQLGTAVDSMSRQLSRLWDQVHRQQGAKLLHQIAGGMAHQLRNTLTGSRMAIELHRQHCPADEKDDVDVAVRQMEVAEDYVRRLLMLGSGQQDQEQPSKLLDCLNDVRSSHAAVAKHLRVDLQWNDEGVEDGVVVADGPSFSAAISNLILNALQSATSVEVVASVDGGTCVVEVADNGPGVDAAIADELFEPFVTSKPEGMGLGLPLVKRAAEQLGGQVSWRRENGFTRFRFECIVTTKRVIPESAMELSSIERLSDS